MKGVYTFLFALAIAGAASAQIYVQGDGTGKEIFINGVSGSTYTFYVNGYINNNGGEIVNNGGEIELTGDWTNTPVGAITYPYESSGLERFSGSSAQTINGTMNGTVSNYNQFYNLKIDKSASGQYVNLNTDVNVNSSGTLQFESNGIIRTDVSSHGNNGSLYVNELYVRNSSTTAITGYATTGSNNYIEGKLYRQVNGSGTYYFPIGIQPGTLDSEEPFQITTTSATSSNILGYIQPGSTSYIGDDIFCDVGTDPSPTSGTPVTANPGSAADGILDLLDITCQYSVEWVVQPSAAGYTFSFTGIPGTTLIGECTYYTGMTAVGELKWTGKDGLPNNTAATSPAPFYTSGYQTCPNLFVINGITSATSASEYRVLGVDDPSTSILPVELISFTGSVLNNGNLLNWVTASEHDNAYFSLESSADNKNFSAIHSVNGAGNSTSQTKYSFLDTHPKAATTYYKLRAVDAAGKGEYSNTISLTRPINTEFSIFPVPAINTIQVNYTADLASSATLRILSASGVVLLSENIQLTKGNNSFDLNISNLNASVYFLEIHDSMQSMRKQFVKQ